MKNSELKTTIDALESIKTSMPVRVSFAIVKNLRTLKAALEIYNEEHDRIVRKYAADGQQVMPTDDINGFAAEIIELNSIDAGITLEPVKYEDIENLALSVSQANAIMYMLED